MKKLLTILCIMFLLLGCGANDGNASKDAYKIDLTGNKNGDKVYEMLVENSDEYTVNEYEGGYKELTLETTVESDGNEYQCFYSIAYNPDQNDPLISLFNKECSININLDNGDWDTFMFPCEGSNYSCMLILDNKSNKLIGYALGETHDDGSIFFDIENRKMDNEKAEIFKTVDWLKLASFMEIFRKGDDTLFTNVLDADELIRLFTDMNTYLEEYNS